MHKQKYILTIALFLTVVVQVFSQEKDTLKTDVINVVKPYKPSISDAFKVKEKPELEDDVKQDKKQIQYNIFSFPVASTFAPAKSKAERLEKPRREKLYDNYASLGVGNYINILGDLYINKEIGNGHSAGLYVGHHSSQGGIKKLLADDAFSDTEAKLNYAIRSKRLTFNLDGGYQHQMFNWYGIPQPEFDVEKLKNFNSNVKHTYGNAFVSGDINFTESLFQSAQLSYRNFSDSYQSAENHILAKLTGEVPISGIYFLTTVTADVLNGNFKRQYLFDLPINYKNMQFGISPSFKILKDDLSVKLGATGVYSNSTGEKKNAMFIYPNIEASYRIAGDAFIVHAFAKGDLKQNTYHAIANQNPYVSPNLYIQPTSELLNAFGGFKGMISNTVGYDIGGGIKQEIRKPLFKNNLTTYGDVMIESYHLGNSFGLVYDNVTTTTLAGKLNIDVNRNFTLGLKAAYFNYKTKSQEEAWNLPNLKADVFLDYQIDENWFTGANVFFVGERKAITGVQTFPEATTDAVNTITLKSFVDANVNLGYHINERFSAYVKANNLLNNNYQQWLHTPVQGLQFLFGATYKFNF